MDGFMMIRRLQLTYCHYRSICGNFFYEMSEEWKKRSSQFPGGESETFCLNPKDSFTFKT